MNVAKGPLRTNDTCQRLLSTLNLDPIIHPYMVADIKIPYRNFKSLSIGLQVIESFSGLCNIISEFKLE